MLLLVGFSVPSHECSSRSYFIRLSTLSHHGSTEVKVAPPFSEASYLLVPPLPAKKFTRPVPPSGVNSESAIPILRSRHSSASALPVVSAILGMCPSLWLRGRRVTFLSLSALSAQLLTVGMVSSRRHLPTWMTSGTF